MTNNPVFGLNALGGAISIQMKNGFTYHGSEAEVLGGSFGRRTVTLQEASSMATSPATSPPKAQRQRLARPLRLKLRRLYADIGDRGESREFHLSFTGASNWFGAAAATPIELLNQRWSAVYTTPQTYKNQLNFLNATGATTSATGYTQGHVYFRGFRQKHVDGNTSEVWPATPACSRASCAWRRTTTCCSARTVRCRISSAARRQARSTAPAPRPMPCGGSTQLTSTHQLFGHNNHFVVGSSVDRGRVNFGASSELGTIGPDLFVTGTGVIITQPSGEIAPVSVATTNTYSGFYATNTFDLTSQLSFTAGGRFNHVSIRLNDQLGTALNGAHEFHRFNPVAGMTYKLTPQVTAYAGYSESSRVPTPSELACADPTRPCLLDNFLVSDPPLKQVVGKTWEAGLARQPRPRPQQPIEWDGRPVPHRQPRRHLERAEHDHRPRRVPEHRPDPRQGWRHPRRRGSIAGPCKPRTISSTPRSRTR